MGRPHGILGPDELCPNTDTIATYLGHQVADPRAEGRDAARSPGGSVALFQGLAGFVPSVFSARVGGRRFVSGELPGWARFLSSAQRGQRVAAQVAELRLAGVLQFAGGEVRRVLERAIEFGQCYGGAARLERRFTQGQMRLHEQIVDLVRAFPNCDAHAVEHPRGLGGFIEAILRAGQQRDEIRAASAFGERGLQAVAGLGGERAFLGGRPGFVGAGEQNVGQVARDDGILGVGLVRVREPVP